MEKPKLGEYISLYYSNLHKSVPKGEDILYSLFTKVILIGTDTGFGRQKKIWHSHLLITSKGLYFAKYQWRKQPRVKFISWLMVKEICENRIKTIKPRFILKPKRERNLESRGMYQKRKKKLALELLNLMHKGKKIIMDELIGQRNIFVAMSQRERDSLKYLLKDQYIDDFNKITASVISTRYFLGRDRSKLKALYVDIKKQRLKNQVNSVTLEIFILILVLFFLIFLMEVVRIIPWDYTLVSLQIIGVFYSIFLIFDRLRIRKVNFKIPQLKENPLKDGKDFEKYIEYKEQFLMDEFKEKQRSEYENKPNYEYMENELKKLKESHERLEQIINKRKEEQLKRYADTINKLQEMNAHEWEQYLEELIRKMERALKLNLDYFERKQNLTSFNIYQYSALEDVLEDRKNLLANLKHDTRFISSIKERIKNDFISFQRENTSIITPISETLPLTGLFLNLLFKMDNHRLIKYLKSEIHIRQRLIEREMMKRGKTNFLAVLEDGLIQSTLDLKKLEIDPIEVDTIRKRLINTLRDEKREYYADNGEDYYS